MTLRITKLRMSNFRSINGPVDLDLDAPVVLIHGPNGSGKTSLLSAIEVGLTGAVASMRRVDRNYTKDLVHYDSKEAFVSIACRHPGVSPKPNKLTIKRNGEIDSDPLLNKQQARFYAERSFLAQATLGRLLEIYETSDARGGENALTRFVNDLLGLDALDHLIDGLKPAGHKKRLQRSLPLYADAERHLSRLESVADRLSVEANHASASHVQAHALLAEALKPLNFNQNVNLDQLIDTLLNAMSEESTAVELGALHREVSSAMALLEKATNAGDEDISRAENALAEARRTYDVWLSNNGARFDAAIDLASSLIAGLPNAARAGRETTRAMAREEVAAELARVNARLERDETSRSELNRAVTDLGKAQARVVRLGERLESLSSQSGDLARALSELTPFVDGDVCPVCHRDFSEVSKSSLQAHLSGHVARLSQAATELQEVSAERQAARRAIADAQTAIESYTANVLEDTDRAELVARAARLVEAEQRLNAVEALAATGDQISTEIRDLGDRLTKLRQDREALGGIRRSTVGFLSRLSLPSASEDEATSDVLGRCLKTIDERREAIMRREQNRSTALSAAQKAREVEGYKSETDDRLESANREVERAKSAIKKADKIRKSVKALSNNATAVRTEIVRQVFNESLNAVWSDLFVRLAPEEPFVPIFSLDGVDSGPVEAELKTRYRGKEQGGNPKAMLSAGNLNTAALTLFLSLHLSAPPILPWLVIDDPVQSMDEIHIAQFAALLRTLVKQKDRQVIIAVHEKPLFDYLTLELSPASEGDSLITIELSRNMAGQTTYDTAVQVWDPSRIFQVAG